MDERESAVNHICEFTHSITEDTIKHIGDAKDPIEACAAMIAHGQSMLVYALRAVAALGIDWKVVLKQCYEKTKEEVEKDIVTDVILPVVEAFINQIEKEGD